MLIKVRVHPSSKENKIIQKKKDELEAWIREPAEEGRANESLVHLLTRYFEKRVRIVKGARSSHKIIEVLGSQD